MKPLDIAALELAFKNAPPHPPILTEKQRAKLIRTLDSHSSGLVVWAEATLKQQDFIQCISDKLHSIKLKEINT